MGCTPDLGMHLEWVVVMVNALDFAWSHFELEDRRPVACRLAVHASLAHRVRSAPDRVG